VHSSGRRRCRLADVPLDEPISVSLDNHKVDQPVLRDLELNGLLGPLATVSWLANHLTKRDVGALRAGDLILAATPGSLIPVKAGSTVHVQFKELCVDCRVYQAQSHL